MSINNFKLTDNNELIKYTKLQECYSIIKHDRFKIKRHFLYRNVISSATRSVSDLYKSFECGYPKMAFRDLKFKLKKAFSPVTLTKAILKL